MNESAIFAALEGRAQRREDRRQFIKIAAGAVAATGAGAVLSSCKKGTSGYPPATTTPTTPPAAAITDADILNFALNLEYLEAQFYTYAVTGSGLAANLVTGVGAQGTVTAGRKVTFTDPLVAQYALEIQQDELAHVIFLRSQLGSAAVAQPSIDVSASVSSAFSTAARAAGLINATQTFDPYASDENFLLGAFIFEDVGVTAYKGASPLITSKVYLEAAAGILAAEAYHAGLVRTLLYRKGLDTPALRTSSEAISNARDSLDGTSDDDQGVAAIGNQSNIVPTDSNGIAYSRSAAQVLNIVYLNKAAVSTGGFFPAGVNGSIRLSAAN